MSTRKITKEQFANGTTVDGNRLEKAFDDLQNRINNIPLDDIKTRYIPYQIVGGFTPSRSQFLQKDITGGATITSPDDPFSGATTQKTGMDCWLPASRIFNNSIYLEVIGGTIEDRKKENPASVKGSGLNTNYYETDKIVRNWVMSNAYSTSDPVIIDELSVFIGANEHFNKTFVSTTSTYATPPSWFNPSNVNFKSVADIQFFISVDHEDLTESIQLRTNELAKSDFHAWSGHWMQDETLTMGSHYPTDLGLPTLEIPTLVAPNNDIYLNSNCLFFTFKNLKISIPENGRWRLHILIPDYQYNAQFANGTDWGDRPDLFELSFSVTCLEETK